MEVSASFDGKMCGPGVWELISADKRKMKNEKSWRESVRGRESVSTKRWLDTLVVDAVMQYVQRPSLICTLRGRWISTAAAQIPEKIPRFYRKMNDEIRKHHGLIPLAARDDGSGALGMHMSMEEKQLIRIREVNTHLRSVINALIAVSGSVNEVPNAGVEMLLHRKYSGRPLPKFPQHWSRERLIEFMNELTRYHRIQSKYSHQTGLVASVIKDLLRVNNASTRNCLSLEVYNLGVAYFIRNKDIRGARQLCRDMEAVGITPSTETFNIMFLAFRHHLFNPTGHWTVPPLLGVVHNLTKMLRLGVPANAETWNILLSAVPEASNKAMIMEEMQKLNIHLSSRGLAVCVQDIIDQVGPKVVMGFLHNQKSGVGIDTVNTVLSGLIKDRKIKLAWEYLHYAVEKWQLLPTTSTLNTFVMPFAQEARLDWIMGVYSGMSAKWGVKASCLTYEFILEGLVRTPYHGNKHAVLRMICDKSRDVVRTKQAQYWIDRARTQLKYYKSVGVGTQAVGVSRTLQSSSTHNLWEDSMKVFQWGVDPELVYDRDSGKGKLALRLGVFPYRYVTLAENRFRPVDRHLRERIAFYNVQKKELRDRQARKEVQIRKEIMRLGPYEKYVRDLVKEGLIRR
jgi:hypothetical protein